MPTATAERKTEEDAYSYLTRYEIILGNKRMRNRVLMRDDVQPLQWGSLLKYKLGDSQKVSL